MQPISPSLDSTSTTITCGSTLRLPLELICSIFYLTASSSSNACRSLCSVCSWSRDTFLPILLRTVILSSDTQCRHFYPRATNAKHDFRPRLSHMQSLWVDSDVLHAAHHPTLSHQNFPNLRDISMPFTLFTAMALGKHLRPHLGLSVVLVGGIRELRNSLREIQSAFVDTASGSDSPLLSSITHLQLMTIAIGAANPLFHFQNLTHLAMPYFGVLGLEAPLDALEMLVFVVHTSSSHNVHWDCRQRVIKARLGGRDGLYFVEEVDLRFKQRWIQTVRGEFPSVWERARNQTALLEKIYRAGAGDWEFVEESWKEQFIVCA